MSGKKKRGPTLKYWICYLRERKAVIFGYFATVSLFLITGSLYRLENIGKMLYGALLTLAVCGLTGIVCGKRYVDRCIRLENVVSHYEETGELLTKKIGEPEELSEDGSPEGQLAALALAAEEARQKEKNRWEEKESDRKDYYMMWTHQVKTPISALKLLLEENQDCRNGFLMQEELFKIEQYAEMVLTFQRLESISTDLSLESCELTALLKQAVRKYSVLFINKGLCAEVPTEKAWAVTDEKWFSFCLEQLLSNSIKYTPAGKISFSVREREQDVQVILEDTGIGIRPEDLPRIFEKGFTGYNGRLDKRSTGIGLYLCKQVFDRLGIGVLAQSTVGKGTRMTLTLPKPYKSVS
ncbi:MAG: sensor histidine kinase [bacterium]|nr:sensor histidine kinase [bacterium]